MKTRLNGILTLLLALLVQISFAQEKTVSGTVSDKAGPLPGVSVLVKGTSIGTETDFDGKYSIKAKVGNVLTFSFIGYKNVDKKVGSSNTINVTLSEDTNVLDEVVILGYGSQRKTELTSSTVKVKSEDIEQVPVTSVDQVLQGKVAGLVISQNSGTPGSTANIRIRGVSSITAGNEPLYVVDGVPMNNGDVSTETTSLSSLASINSNDIESITVLKDASATAAYGARGANGVIVITTKSGKQGKTTFKFDSTYGFQNDATPGPQVLTGAQREMLFYEAIFNTFGGGVGNNGLNTVADAKAFYNANLGYFGSDYATWNANGRKEAHWDQVITNKNAVVQQYNFTASGGDDKHTFYTSLGYFNQDATVIGASFKRISGSLNISQNLTDKLKFTSRNQASYSFQDGLLDGSSYFSSPRAVKFFMPPIDQPYNADGTLNLNIGLPNPIYVAKHNNYDSKYTRIISNQLLEWDTPIENLKLSSRVNIDYQIYNDKTYYNRIEGDGVGTNGYGYVAARNTVTFVFSNTADYAWTINDNHRINFTAVQEFQKNKSNFISADGDSFAADGLTNLASAGNPTSAYSSFSDWAVARYLGLIHYAAFDGRYVLDLTYTREGNSRFSPENRWGNFGSVGAAWNIFKEGFMQGFDFINNLKLRTSYGITGNANIGLNNYQSLFGFGSSYGGSGAVNPASFGNKDLSWETSHTLDIGMEFGLFDNKVSGSVGYYRRESKDLLLNVPLSRTTGFSSQTRNIGRMENKGIEAELNVNIIRSQDFNFSIGGNLATNKNKVLELAKDGNGKEITITGGLTKVETGHPVYAWHMRTWAGVDPANGDELYYVDPTVDKTTTNVYNNAKEVYQGGSAIPTLTAGINIHLDYKGIFLDANGYYSGGNKVYEDWARYTNGTDLFTTSYYQGVTAVLDRWQKPGDTGKRFGKFRYTTDPWQQNSKFLYDGDFFRLKNLTVGYDFNAKMTKSMGLSSARFFVRGTNLYTWVKDKHLKYDPEVGSGGIASLVTPPVKSVAIGINVKF